jgi:hypothetical protein
MLSLQPWCPLGCAPGASSLLTKITAGSEEVVQANLQDKPEKTIFQPLMQRQNAK